MANEADLLKQIAELKTENDKLRENETKQVQAQVKLAQEEKSRADEALKAANEKNAALAEEVKTGKASKEELEKKYNALAEDLKKVQATQKRAERLAFVKSTLKVNESDAEAVKAANDLVDSLSEISDEKFDLQVKSIAKFTPAPLAPKETPAPLPPKQTNKPAPMAGKAGEETDPAEKNASTENLDTAVANKDAALGTDTTSEVDNLRKSIASYFGCEIEDESKE